MFDVRIPNHKSTARRNAPLQFKIQNPKFKIACGHASLGCAGFLQVRSRSLRIQNLFNL